LDIKQQLPLSNIDFKAIEDWDPLKTIVTVFPEE
jgi:hypothetical protein